MANDTVEKSVEEKNVKEASGKSKKFREIIKKDGIVNMRCAFGCEEWNLDELSVFAWYDKSNCSVNFYVNMNGYDGPTASMCGSNTGFGDTVNRLAYAVLSEYAENEEPPSDYVGKFIKYYDGEGQELIDNFDLEACMFCVGPQEKI